MAAYLSLFNSDVCDCEFIFVFASGEGSSGAGHRGTQISSDDASEYKVWKKKIVNVGEAVVFLPARLRYAVRNKRWLS